MRICLLNINEITDYEPVRKLLPLRYRRAMQYRGEGDRLRCIGAGLLLIKELGIQRENDILHTPDGKPFLAEGPSFSLSHSGIYCALAIGDGKVGIDIERMEEVNLQALEVAANAAEQAWILEKDQLMRFYRLWTRKEALAKAIGTGHFSDPGEIDLNKYDEKCFSTVFREGYCISTYEDNEK